MTFQTDLMEFWLQLKDIEMCLNTQDKVALLTAVRAVCFCPNLAAGVHKKQKEFNCVRQKLCNKGNKTQHAHPWQTAGNLQGRDTNFRYIDRSGEYHHFGKFMRRIGMNECGAMKTTT